MKEPLSLPYGSVRALLAITLTLGLVVQYVMYGDAPLGLLVLTAVSDGYYFGWRTAQVARPSVETVEAPSLPPPLLREGAD